jgi:twitching motility protein PilI
LHGVVDLARFLGLPEAPAADPGREHARLIAVGASLGLNVALLVDRLAGLRASDQLHPHADAADGSDVARPHFAPERWRDNEGRSWQALDLDALAHDVRFVSIVA